MRAVYPYTAQGADELGLQEGEMIELTGGPTGGRNFGDGWWEGERDLSFVASTVAPITSIEPGINSKGGKGIFPSNYVGHTSFSQFSSELTRRLIGRNALTVGRF